MTGTLPRDLRGDQMFRHVHDLVTAVREPAVGRVVDATDLDSSPDGSMVAFTAWRRLAVSGHPEPTIGLVVVATGALRLLDEPAGGGSRRLPLWSPDGSQLLGLRTTAADPAFREALG